MRRRWLLSTLSGPLEYCARDRRRLLDLLALPDLELLEAVAGRRKAELRARYERVGAIEHGLGLGGAQSEGAHEPKPDRDAHAICRHDRGYPSALAGPAAPHMLEVAGDDGRLPSLAEAPVVAILGTRTASDYGVEMARSLARGLTVSGVSVAANLIDGIAIAAHTGCVEAGGGGIAVIGGGLGVACPARSRALYERLLRCGCAVSELPWNCRGRRWGQLASERIVVGLAELAVVVEADSTPEDLAGARIAQGIGRKVAAIPGRVTSPLSRGTHALLLDGASLVRGAKDVLELLYTDDEEQRRARVPPERSSRCATHVRIDARLKATLERVGAGCDTPDKLTRAGEDSREVLLALSELELMGLLARGDGGRYVARDPLPACDPPARRNNPPHVAQTGHLRRI